MAYEYDEQNIFAKIIRREIPNDTVMETDFTLAFRDIMPQAPEHILVIPKGFYVNYDHFASEATDAEVIDFTRVIGAISHAIGATPANGGSGYRLIANTGKDGVQDVPHLHIHILSGRRLGRMLQPA